MVKKRYIAITAVIGVAVTYLLICGFSFIKTGFGLFDSHENEYGKFVRVGDMHYARSGHKAVLLQDGRVLIVGGASEPVAEIYDPEKRKFYKTGSMRIDRDDFTATLLQNGKVLIAGGQRGNTPLNDVELYNPNTKSFEKAPELNFSRHSHTATLLSDGRVLIVGGQGPSGEKTHTWAVKKSEIYDPKTDTFEIGPEMNIPRVKHDSILLNNGNVLIAGGYNNKRHRSAEIYDVKKNKFIQVADMNHIRVKPQLIKLKSGKILVVSGYGYPPNWSTAKDIKGPGKYGWAELVEIYDPETKTFKKLIENNLSAPASNAALLKNGNILFTGGDIEYRWYFKNTNGSALLNPVTKELIKGPNLHKERGGAHTGILLNDGTVLVVGGDTAELYVPKYR